MRSTTARQVYGAGWWLRTSSERGRRAAAVYARHIAGQYQRLDRVHIARCCSPDSRRASRSRAWMPRGLRLREAATMAGSNRSGERRPSVSRPRSALGNLPTSMFMSMTPGQWSATAQNRPRAGSVLQLLESDQPSTSYRGSCRPRSVSTSRRKRGRMRDARLMVTDFPQRIVEAAPGHPERPRHIPWPGLPDRRRQ